MNPWSPTVLLAEIETVGFGYTLTRIYAEAEDPSESTAFIETLYVPEDVNE